MIMKNFLKKALTLTMVVMVLVAGSVTTFAAKGNGIKARDRLKDNTCDNVCIYENECPNGCDKLQDGSCGICPNDGVCTNDCDRLQDGSCGICPNDGTCPQDGSCGTCPNDGVPAQDGSGGVNAKGKRNNVK